MEHLQCHGEGWLLQLHEGPTLTLETVSYKKNQAQYTASELPGLQKYTKREVYYIAHVHKGPPLPSFLTGNLVSTQIPPETGSFLFLKKSNFIYW